MKKTVLIIFSFVLLAAGLTVFSACSIKSPSVKQTSQAVNEVSRENPITTTVENNTVATTTVIATENCGTGYSTSSAGGLCLKNVTEPELRVVPVKQPQSCDGEYHWCQGTQTCLSPYIRCPDLSNCRDKYGDRYSWCESMQKCIDMSIGCPTASGTVIYMDNSFDAKTFKIGDGVVEDKNGVYIDSNGELGWIKFDLKTFKESNYYFWDKNKVIFMSMCGGSRDAKIINQADPVTFQVLKYDYAKDKRNVYNLGEIIPITDRNSFKIIDQAYSRDESGFYYTTNCLGDNIEVKGADVNSFKVSTSTNQLYWSETGFANIQKDKNHIFCDGVILVGADINTFRFLNDQEMLALYGSSSNYAYVYVDKNNYYDEYCKIIGKVNSYSNSSTTLQ